jgi:hypothetical protein
MFKRIGMLMLAGALTATIAAAQEKKAEPKTIPPTAPAAKAAPEPDPLPINIRIEVSITDQSGSGTPAKKVVSMIASDRQSTNIRSSASVPVPSTIWSKPPGATDSTPANVPAMSYTYRNVTINVDARPVIVRKEPNRVSLSLGLEYMPRTEGRQEEMAPGMASWSERRVAGRRPDVGSQDHGGSHRDDPQVGAEGLGVEEWAGSPCPAPLPCP